jgi:bifunctional non-homologous end joining protein LigD
MLATLVKEAFDRQGWLFEIKWDGYRALAEIRDKRVLLYSRRDTAFNDRFPAIVRALCSLPFDALLDGEIVVVDESGEANFQMLQDYPDATEGTLVYYVFDLLHFNGFDLTGLPLFRRKEILRQILPRVPHIALSDHIEKEGLSLFKAASESMVEGIVAKDGMSPYRPGQRSRQWLKIKATLRQEAIIGGFTEPRGGRKGFGALVLGVYEEDRLVYIGRGGGGFTDRQLDTLKARLEPLAREKSPFPAPPTTNQPVTWVEPKLVCEVRFAEWTKEGLMRQPVFLGLREDIDPREVKRETAMPTPEGPARSPDRAVSLTPGPKGGLIIINDAKVKLSNPDKVFWPEEGYTKRDVIDYYREIAPFILPYLKGRPESLHRHPNGVEGDAFFQKNVDHLTPDWVHTVTILSESEGKNAVYLVCEDEATLVYMANLGCIEINPWHSRIGHLEEPDFMVLDIDPLDVPFTDVVKAALMTHEVLNDADIRSFCKTSGATGLHIYVPLNPGYSYDQSTQFARLVNVLVHGRLPQITSMERSPERRKGKVYLDYLQNSRGQTLAAPYCIRPRKGAPVSTPLAWAEVNERLDPTHFTIKTTAERLRRVGDLWKGVLGPGIDMAASLERLGKMPKS